jgi:hypothetical protein
VTGRRKRGSIGVHIRLVMRRSADAKTEPAFEDMLTQLRRVLITARISKGSGAPHSRANQSRPGSLARSSRMTAKPERVSLLAAARLTGRPSCSGKPVGGSTPAAGQSGRATVMAELFKDVDTGEREP